MAPQTSAPTVLSAIALVFTILLGLVCVGVLTFAYIDESMAGDKETVRNVVLVVESVLCLIPIGVLVSLPNVQMVRVIREEARPPAQAARPAAPVMEIKAEEIEIIDEEKKEEPKKVNGRTVRNYPPDLKPSKEYIISTTMVPIDPENMLAVRIPVMLK